MDVAFDAAPGQSNWQPSARGSGGPSPQSHRLAAGHQATVSPASGAIEVRTYPVDAIGAWRRDRLVYFDAPLWEVVADARRYSALSIEIVDEDLEDLRISATFDGNDIEGMLLTLPALFPVAVDRTSEAGIVLSARH